MTLLTDTDLPWVTDGLQRDGPYWRTAVDRRLRQVLVQQALHYVLIQGHGEARTANALKALGQHPGAAQHPPDPAWLLNRSA